MVRPSHLYELKSRERRLRVTQAPLGVGSIESDRCREWMQRVDVQTVEQLDYADIVALAGSDSRQAIPRVGCQLIVIA